MGEKSSVDQAVSLGVAAVGDIQVLRWFQGLRHRETSPHMDDPNKALLRWLPDGSTFRTQESEYLAVPQGQDVHDFEPADV